MNICLNDKIFETLSSVVTSENVKAYVIGGWVRDCILKREHTDKDIDIVVIGSGIEIAQKAARKIKTKLTSKSRSSSKRLKGLSTYES